MKTIAYIGVGILALICLTVGFVAYGSAQGWDRDIAI